MQSSNRYDAVIVGGGPAGLTAGIYLGRGGWKTLMLEREVTGGQAGVTNNIENYPGFPESIDGPDLAVRMEEQAVRFGLNLRYEEATKLELDGPVKRIHTTNGEIQATTVILAMGAKPRKLGVTGEQQFEGRGVSYCATCDGNFFKGRPVIVVGGGDTAAEDALVLARLCPSVTLIHRRDTLRAQRILIKRIMETPNITVLWDTVVEELSGDKMLERARVKNVKTGEEQTLEVPGVFIAVGSVPQNQLVKDQMELDEEGRIIVDPRTMATPIPGVYVAGDIRDTPLRQIVVATSDGALAATAAERYMIQLEK